MPAILFFYFIGLRWQKEALEVMRQMAQRRLCFCAICQYQLSLLLNGFTLIPQSLDVLSCCYGILRDGVF